MFKLTGKKWEEVYYYVNAKGGRYSSLPYIKSIKKLGIEDVYDIIDVDKNHNYFGNMLLLSNSESWNKLENKQLKVQLAKVRTKHLLYIMCFPLKIMKVDKVYLESYVNYWIDLFARGYGALYVKDKNPYSDSWRMKDFQNIGSYTEFTNVNVVKNALSKHPNFWYIIKAPRPSAALYSKYLKVREFNVYDDANVLDTMDKSDVVRALLLVTLREILTRDSTLSIKRLLMHLENEYQISIDKSTYDNVMEDAKMLSQKVKENDMGRFIK